MSLKGVHCVRGYVDMAEHYRCMVEEIGPPCGIEPTMLQRITEPNLERARERVVYSHSTITSCHRRSALSGQHDWYVDVDMGYKTIRGSFVHDGLENDPPYPGVLGTVREVRMGRPIETSFGEKTFHGKADLVVMLSVDMPGQQGYEWLNGENVLHVKIVDYKTKSEVGHELADPEPKHVWQVNEYAWILEWWLPKFLNGEISTEFAEHVKLNVDEHNNFISLPYIDRVVVDELSIVYLDMKKSRTFTSKGFLYAKGKMKGVTVNGRWRRKVPTEYEELELAPIHVFDPAYLERKIRKGIEDQTEAETYLAPPLVGEAAKEGWCMNCPVLNYCVEIGREEGYSMEDQLPYYKGTDNG